VFAALLGSRRGSLLHRSLVRNSKLATEVSSFTFDLPVAADLLIIDVTAHPGVASESLEVAVANELRHVVEHGVRASDVERAVAVAENEVVVALESSEGRADALSKFASYFGDPRLALEYTARLRNVTRERLEVFAQRYVQPQEQVSLLYIPRDGETLGAV
ncbi:MAG: insulinase family protein, partial [Gemmatimonadaceae bacterium]